MKYISILLIFSVLISGCASMFHGTKDTIYVRSNEPETTFFANSREIGKGTSAVVTLPKKDLDRTRLRAEKTGCLEKSSPIETSFDAISLLGILIDWGIISILVVDLAATGATTRAAQTDYILTPECPKMAMPSQLLVQPALSTNPPTQQPAVQTTPAQ